MKLIGRYWWGGEGGGVCQLTELQVRVRRPLLARDPAVLHLDEVRLEEADLVLAVDARRVGVLAHHREVVEHLAAVDGGLGLRDEPRNRVRRRGVSP